MAFNNRGLFITQNGTLVELTGADHSFKKGKENLIPRLASETREWIDSIL
jgi:hypothetical protein